MDEILDWIFADSWRVFLVQIILWTGGVLAVVYGLILLVRSKLRHEALPREFAVEFFFAGALIPACCAALGV